MKIRSVYKIEDWRIQRQLRIVWMVIAVWAIIIGGLFVVALVIHAKQGRTKHEHLDKDMRFTGSGVHWLHKETWQDSVLVCYSEKFYNNLYDFSSGDNTTEKALLDLYFRIDLDPRRAAILIEEFFSIRMDQCTDNDASDAGCDSCWQKIYGEGEKP